VTDGCFYGDGGMFRVAPPLELKAKLNVHKKLEAIFRHKLLTQIHEKNPEKRSDLGFLEFQVMGIQDITAVEGQESGL
jgi:hypothetical protein